MAGLSFGEGHGDGTQQGWRTLALCGIGQWSYSAANVPYSRRGKNDPEGDSETIMATVPTARPTGRAASSSLSSSVLADQDVLLVPQGQRCPTELCIWRCHPCRPGGESIEPERTTLKP